MQDKPKMEEWIEIEKSIRESSTFMSMWAVVELRNTTVKKSSGET